MDTDLGLSGHELTTILDVAENTVFGGFTRLSARFTAINGYPDTTPGYLLWKKTYLNFVASTASRHLAFLEQEEKFKASGQSAVREEPADLAPEEMVEGRKYEVIYRLGAQHYERRAVVIFVGIKKPSGYVDARRGTIYTFRGKASASPLELGKSDIGVVREADPAIPCYIGAKADIR